VWEEVATKWYQSMVQHFESMEEMSFSCMHGGYLCACYVCMVIFIVTIVFPCRSLRCCCWDVSVMNACPFHMYFLYMQVFICCYGCIIVAMISIYQVSAIIFHIIHGN